MTMSQVSNPRAEVVAGADAYLASFGRLVRFWRDGELTDEEFLMAKATLLELEGRPESLYFPANVVIPLD